MSTPSSEMNRRQQIAATFRMTRQYDPKAPLWILGTALLAAGVGFLIFFVLVPAPNGVISLIMAIFATIMFGTLGGMIVFGRRAQSAAYRRMEGQRGGGAAALGMLKRGWKTQPAVAFTKQQDVVHRVVGRPGIVLVGEGNPQRLRQLISSERRKHERVVSEVPVHEMVVGHGEGQVPVAKLIKTVRKMPKALKPAEMTDVLSRLKALDAQRPAAPIPKGPVPTSMKGMRGQMRGR